jgi:hypothetical protein
MGVLAEREGSSAAVCQHCEQDWALRDAERMVLVGVFYPLPMHGEEITALEMQKALKTVLQFAFMRTV